MVNFWGYQIDSRLLFWTLIGLTVAIIIKISLKKSRQLEYIRNYEFNPNIQNRLSKKYPDLTDNQISQVLQGLQNYFAIYHKTGRKIVAIPSLIADDAWCEFTLLTRSYWQFCRNAFGRFLHHTPIKIMIATNHANIGIKDAWRLACIQEQINPQNPVALPSLFQLDVQLGIQDGFVYRLSSPLDKKARCNCENSFIYNLYCEYADKQYCIEDIGRACKGECIGC
ncbi:glycine-rich domain-containing protein [Methylomonas koyamae]|uniref:glycine-rich domain-containing protein n=1 Tax=Methylomonas koyamae TaxID=702114 RepID=UPI00112D4486|nr:hypothetical protein [Methylomonas koyamae]TPQ26254.1 hypothetical protein C2U68_11930 [Methylomonas koyamae]